PHYIAELIEKSGVTMAQFVPSMLAVFLDRVSAGRCKTLRHVICSGEALPAELTKRFHAKLGADLYNLYGPTETSIEVSWWRCQKTDDRPAVPIGFPLSNTLLYVLDDRMEPAPVGVPGELYIGGIQVSRGYWRKPALTAERFVPNPFGGKHTRLYRTGDRARFRRDGAVEYLGRIDHQVKLRGFRIE